MVKLLVYTKRGRKKYGNFSRFNYPGHIGYNCDLNDSVHIALSKNGKKYQPMRNNTGILFAEADFETEEVGGTTKTLRHPWIFRTHDKRFAIAAVRRNRNACDDKNVGSIMLFYSDDCLRFTRETFLQLSENEIEKPMIFRKGAGYRIVWKEEKIWYCCYSPDLINIEEITEIEKPLVKKVKCNIKKAIVGNEIDVTDEEAKVINNAYGMIENTNVIVAPIYVKAGEDAFEPFRNVKATCFYTDGSTHVKPVKLNENDYLKIDFSKRGEYLVRGEVLRETYPFPFVTDEHISDPCVFPYRFRYYLTNSRGREVVLRVSDSIETIPESTKITIWRIPEEETELDNMWAQELHVIKGIPYIFTTVGHKEWTTVQAHILRCNGKIENPNDWEAPRLVVKPNGTPLEEEGISLDMTYYEDNGKHYVMWSNRKIIDPDEKNPVADTADIFIATIDPDAPWQLTSEPVCILRPKYGWERCETNVEEGPYFLRHGEDVFVTVSASSTGLADLYCLGLLHTKVGADLLNPENWDFLPYPVLTKESVKGEYGPGHNSFFRNPDTDNDILAYHAVPHGAFHKTKSRHMGMRRVHWKKDGYPYFEMTDARDLKKKFEKITLKVVVE